MTLPAAKIIKPGLEEMNKSVRAVIYYNGRRNTNILEKEGWR